MWIVVTVLLYLTIGAAIGVHMWNMEQAKNLSFVVGQYFSVHRLGYTVQVERGLWSISSFGVWFRLLRCATPFFLSTTARAHCPTHLYSAPLRQLLQGSANSCNKTTWRFMQVLVSVSLYWNFGAHHRQGHSSSVRVRADLLCDFHGLCAVLLHGILRICGRLPDVPGQHHVRAAVHCHGL